VEDSEGSEEPEESEEEEEELKDGEDGDNQDTEKKRKKKTKAAIEKEALEMGDLYALLHLDEHANDKEVKTAFRKASLKYHPDKLKRTVTEEDKEHWLLV